MVYRLNWKPGHALCDLNRNTHDRQDHGQGENLYCVSQNMRLITVVGPLRGADVCTKLSSFAFQI